MSDLTETIAAEHHFVEWMGTDPRCKCGAVLRVETKHRGQAIPVHVAEVTESTLRAQIAAEVEELKFNPGGIRLFIQMGGTVAWTEGWDDALTTAAETIRGDLTPTPCDCGIECACATDRKDAS